MTVLKTYEANTPLNACAISPLKEHVIVGGGQQASDVTMTATGAGKFETRFYHMVFEEEIGLVKGHFGPINTLAFHPHGRSFASGAEDGYIRLHHLDDDYFVETREERELDDKDLESLVEQFKAGGLGALDAAVDAEGGTGAGDTRG